MSGPTHGKAQAAAASTSTPQAAGSVLQRQSARGGHAPQRTVPGIVRFRDVLVHADRTAATFAQAVNGNADTVGRDVVFDAAQYQPHDRGGRELIAHELTHLVQRRFKLPASPEMDDGVSKTGKESPDYDSYDIRSQDLDEFKTRHQFLPYDELSITWLRSQRHGWASHRSEQPLNRVRHQRQVDLHLRSTGRRQRSATAVAAVRGRYRAAGTLGSEGLSDGLR